MADDSLIMAAKEAKMEENDIEKCLSKMDDSETKDALRMATEQAVDYGVTSYSNLKSIGNSLSLT